MVDVDSFVAAMQRVGQVQAATDAYHEQQARDERARLGLGHVDLDRFRDAHERAWQANVQANIEARNQVRRAHANWVQVERRLTEYQAALIAQHGRDHWEIVVQGDPSRGIPPDAEWQQRWTDNEAAYSAFVAAKGAVGEAVEHFKAGVDAAQVEAQL